MMMTSRKINDLLDRIERLKTRDEKIMALRGWIEQSLRASEAERSEERRERLGKLGGG